MSLAGSIVIGSTVIEIRTDDRQVDRGLAETKGKVNAAVDRMQSDVDAKTKGLSKQISGDITRVAAAAAISAGVGLLGQAVQMAREEEVGLVRLQSTLKNAGVSWERYGGSIERVVQQRTKMAFADQELRDSLATLVAGTGSLSEALRRQTVAMDLARGSKKSLAEASFLLSKVSDENTGALRRMGIVVKDGATAMDVLAAVEARYGGAAADFANTSEAAAIRTKNAFENASEAVGGFVDKQLPVIAAVATTWGGFGLTTNALAGAFLRLSSPSKLAASAIGLMSGALVKLRIAANLLFLAGGPIAWGIRIAIALAVALKLLYDRSEGFRRIVHALGDVLGRVFGPLLKVAGTVLGWIGDRLGDVGKALGLVGDEAEENLGDDIPGAAAEAQQSIFNLGKAVTGLRDMFKPAGAAETEAFLKSIGMDEATINLALDAIYDTVGAGSAARFQKITDQAYAKLQPQAREAIFAEADAMAKIVEEGGAALDDAAREAHLTVGQYMDRAAQKTKEAEDRLKIWSETVAKSIETARTQAQEQDVQFSAADARENAQIANINRITQAWYAAQSAAISYAQSAVPNVIAGGPSTWRGGGGRLLQGGFHGVVGPGHGGPMTFTAGEGAHAERVDVGPVSEARRREPEVAAEAWGEPSPARADEPAERDRFPLGPLGSAHFAAAGAEPPVEGARTFSVVLNQTLNYQGDALAMARDAAARVLDDVTEAFRQQSRRLTA